MLSKRKTVKHKKVLNLKISKSNVANLHRVSEICNKDVIFRKITVVSSVEKARLHTVVRQNNRIFEVKDCFLSFFIFFVEFS